MHYSRGPMMKKNKLYVSTQISPKANIALNGLMILLALACLYPLLLVLGVSLTTEGSISEFGYKLIPREFSIDAYKYILGDAEKIIRAYGVSIFITVFGTCLSLMVIIMYAYPLSRKDFKYRKMFTFIVFFTMLFNGGLIPVYFVYVKILHLKDNLFAMILFWMMNPFYVMIAKTFFQTSIPDSVVEAAKIDGATEFRTFRSIVLPLAKPVLGTIAMFNVLWYWNDWYTPMLFIQDESLFNLQYLMYRVESNIQYLITHTNAMSQGGNLMADLPSQTARMAMAIIAIGPLVLAYPFFQRYFVEGITLGASKE